MRRSVHGIAHLIQLEIAGPTALWTRADSGSCPRSYPAPTFSAAKGIFEAVRNWQRLVVVKPTRTEICAPVQYDSYTTNYGGPLRKDAQIKKGAPFQLHAEVLIDVIYRLHAQVVPVEHAYAQGLCGGQIAAQEYCKVFNRVIRFGGFHHMPFLGWKEFVPSYLGPFRDSTSVCQSENHFFPTMRFTVFDQLRGGQINPEIRHSVGINEGVLSYV